MRFFNRKLQLLKSRLRDLKSNGVEYINLDRLWTLKNDCKKIIWCLKYQEVT